MRDRSLPMYVFAIVAQRSPSYVAVSVPHSNSDIYLNSEKKSVESNMFPETLETGAFFARGHGSNATEHIELFPTRGKMFWSINSFLLLYPILFETSFAFSPHNFKHFFFTYAGYIMFVT